MTGVTVVDAIEAGGNLGTEIVKFTFTDGYTYTSRFGTVVAAFANSNSRTGSWCSVSGQVVTVHCSSASGDTGWLVVYGR